MSLFELFILAIGLSMDAFAVSVCKGLSVSRVKGKHMLTCGVYFGLFQGLMPLIGYLLGVNFQDMIEIIDHWVAFVLLGFIGVNMIREALGPDEDCTDSSFGFKAMVLLAIATSIDALAVGVTFAFLDVQIVPAVCFIGVITFCLSALGVKLGNIFGMKWKKRAEFAGGAILVCMGVKILVEHLFF